MKMIILGVGNPILRDDGIGIYVVQELRQHINDPNVTIDEALTGGMNLLEMTLGYETAILIDALKMKNGKTGEVKCIPPEDLVTIHPCNPYDINFPTALQLAKEIGGDKIPYEILVIGIIVNNVSSFGERLSPQVAEAVPKAVGLVLAEIRKDISKGEKHERI